MPQQHSLAQHARDRADDLRIAWEWAIASGAVRAAEARIISPIVADLCRLTGLVNLSQQTGLAYIRRGSDAQRPRALIRALDSAQDSSIEEPILDGGLTIHRSARQRRLLCQAMAMGLRLKPDSGHANAYIVWEPGEEGFCELVSVDACSCRRFTRWGGCPHHALVIDTVRIAQGAADVAA